MSSLESKTAGKIVQEISEQISAYIVKQGSIRDGTAIVESDSEHFERIENLRCRKWTPTVDAQKEIADWKEAKKAWDKQVGYLKEDIGKLEAKIEAANKKVKDIKLDAILGSMLAIYEGSSEWNKGFKAGAADMIIKIQKELLPILEIPRIDEHKLLDEAHEGCPGCHKPVQDCTCKYPIKEEATK
jgi:predicted RNase H-like nuclease (RuvC/YqgF family)